MAFLITLVKHITYLCYMSCRNCFPCSFYNLNGKFIAEIANVVKYAPSACNTQPWRVICHDNCLKIYRNRVLKCFFPADRLPFYNSIDMGIFLCFLEITLGYNGYEFDRMLCPNEDTCSELIETAIYTIRKSY